MSQDPRVQDNRKFIETCLELELLHQTDAESLSKAIAQDSVIAQTALQRGLLTPAEVDIVQSLQYPTQIVPGYKILELIGRGAMGVVYRAEQLDLEKIVALKTILISNVHDPTVAARFEREAKSLAKLQHPSIVQALNFGKHQGRYYFAMEYVPGRTCEQRVRDVGFMPAEEVWSIVRQVSSGLMHALRQNLIHRDIKPANLILLPPPEGAVSGTEIVKIADFGLAMFADQSADQLKLTTGDKIMGSPAYMSLEQFGGRQVDFRSDMYSLGATAWHLLFGTPPFQGSTVAALFQQKSQPLVIDPSTLPVTLPEDQLRLLMGLLDPDPNQRPQDYQQLIEAIDALGVSASVAPSVAQATSDPGTSSQVAISDQPTIEIATPMAPGGVSSPAGTGDAMSPAVELARSSVIAWSNRTKWLMATASLGVVVVAIGLLPFGSTTRGARTHTRVVRHTPLFDGVTLLGWDVGGSMVGAWNSVEAPDSSTAIACTTPRGALTRRIPETPHPRISLFVWLQPGGGPVDIDFALDHGDPSDVRGCLRMSGETNQLGEKQSDFGELALTLESDALPTVYDRYHVVHIERQPTDWYVFLEEQLLGTLPVEQVGDGDAIRLVVHRGVSSESAESHAFFADVQLSDLRKQEQAD